MNFSSMKMFAEVKCSFVGPFDDFNEVIDSEAQKYELTSVNRDELLVKPKDAIALENWEIRIYRTKKFFFVMSSCINDEHFVEVFESIIKGISSYLTPEDVIAMGVQGNYLYPVVSIQEFSQLVFAWSDNYISDASTQVEISDLGVDVSFPKENLKINIICKLLSRTEATNYFPMADLNSVHEINLFIKIQVSTNEPLKLQKSITLSLSQTIKNHVQHATKLIEQRLKKGDTLELTDI